MSIDQLSGRYFRLRQELAITYCSLPWNTGQIDRLTDDLAVTEREIAAAVVGHHHVVKAPFAYTDPARFSSH